MARHGENIYLRKDGRYEGRYVIGKKANGHTAFGYVYSKKYTDVKKKLDILKGEQLQKGNTQLVNCSKGTIKDWIFIWLEDQVKGTVKETTYSLYRSQIEKYIIPLIGNEKLRTVDKSVMSHLYQEMKANGATEKTAQYILRRFQAFLRYACDENVIHKVPVLPFKRAVSASQSPRFLTNTEQNQLVSHLNEKSKKDMAVLFSLYTGVRIGECCALKWKEIDFYEGTAHISHTLQRMRTHEGENKTVLRYSNAKTYSAIRNIPLTANILQMLARVKAAAKPDEEDFIFGTPKKLLEPRNLQYHIKKLSKSTGIEALHFHTLRHTFATRCMEKGTDIKTLSELLGHSSAKITLDWYCHSTLEQKKVIIEKLV